MGMNVEDSYAGWELDNRGKAVMVASHVVIERRDVPEYLEEYVSHTAEDIGEECKISGYLLGKILHSGVDSLLVHFGCLHQDLNVAFENVIQIVPDDIYIDPLTFGMPCLSGLSRRFA